MTLQELHEIERLLDDRMPSRVEIAFRRLLRYSRQLRAQVRAAATIYETEQNPYRKADAMYLCLAKEKDASET